MASERNQDPPHEAPPWLAGLEEEDLQFVKRFLLASGSLKDLAAQYGISYPTVRLRLDRLIEKIRLLDKTPDETPLVRRVKLMVIEGRLDAAAARDLIKAHRQSLKGLSKTERR